MTVTSEPPSKLLIDGSMSKKDLRLVVDLSDSTIATVRKDGSIVIHILTQICQASNTQLIDDHRITKKEAAHNG